MENKTLISIALFAIVILLCQSLYTTPQVFALSISTMNSGYQSSDGTKTYYLSSSNRFVYATSSPSVTKVLNAVNEAYTTTTVNRPAVEGSGYLYSDDMYCDGVQYCYVSENKVGVFPSYMLKFDPVTGLKNSVVSVGDSGSGLYDVEIVGMNTAGLTARGNGLFATSCTAGGPIGITFSGAKLGTCSGTHINNNNIFNMKASGSKVAVTTGAGSNGFEIWDSSTGTRTCQVNVVMSNGGALERYNSNWYVVVGTTTVNKYSDSCSAGTGISSTGLSGQIQDIELASNEGLMLLHSNTAVAGMNLTSTNISTQVFLTSFGITGTTNTRGTSSVYSPTQHLYVANLDLGSGNNKLVLLKLSDVEESGEEGEEGTTGTSLCSDTDIVCSDFCEQTENINKLRCRNEAIEASGGVNNLGAEGAYVIGNTTEGTGILGIGCGIGWIDCQADPDPATNGLGILLFLASIFVVVGMFYRSLGAEATFHMPLFIWILIIISLSVFFTTVHLIDPTFLIISIVAVIALCVPKLQGIIAGGNTLGGGSTA